MSGETELAIVQQTELANVRVRGRGYDLYQDEEGRFFARRVIPGPRVQRGLSETETVQLLATLYALAYEDPSGPR